MPARLFAFSRLRNADVFATKVGRLLKIDSVLDNTGNARRYSVKGQVSFASADEFNAAFDFKEAIEHVQIDVSESRIERRQRDAC